MLFLLHYLFTISYLLVAINWISFEDQRLGETFISISFQSVGTWYADTFHFLPEHNLAIIQTFRYVLYKGGIFYILSVIFNKFFDIVIFDSRFNIGIFIAGEKPG